MNSFLNLLAGVLSSFCKLPSSKRGLTKVTQSRLGKYSFTIFLIWFLFTMNSLVPGCISKENSKYSFDVIGFPSLFFN